MVRLIGPGGAGKSTIGALLAARMGASFVDLDRFFSERIGDISQFIEQARLQQVRPGAASTRFRSAKKTGSEC